MASRLVDWLVGWVAEWLLGRLNDVYASQPESMLAGPSGLLAGHLAG